MALTALIKLAQQPQLSRKTPIKNSFHYIIDLAELNFYGSAL
jgi:hypothetical protein